MNFVYTSGNFNVRNDEGKQTPFGKGRHENFV